MRIQELHRTGVTDNEDLGEHERSAANVDFAVSFAHEQGYSELFKQLLSMPQFKESLERDFAQLFQRKMQDMIRQSNARPGSGWTDDLEVECSISPR